MTAHFIFYLILTFASLQIMLAQNCEYSFDNFTCICHQQTILCTGSHDSNSALIPSIINISTTHFKLSELNNVSITLNKLDLSSNFTFANISFKSLKLGQQLVKINDDLFDSLNGNLIYLDLSNNDFEHVPSNALKVLSNLEHLNLSHNKIESLSDQDLSGLKSLKTLSLEFNYISRMKDPFATSREIVFLNLGFNDLRDLNSSDFTNLANLKQLNLSSNAVKDILPGTFDNLDSLYELDISRNPLASFLRIQITSASLEKLYASNCSLQRDLSRNTLENIINLQVLDISYNYIQEIKTNSLSKLVKLQMLNLNNNRIQIIRDRAFSSLIQLVDLNLSHNNVSLLEKDCFKNLTKLETLSLSENKLKNISCSHISDLYSLKRLELQDNEIQTIAPGTFKANLNLTTIKLGGNLFNCTTMCPAIYLASYLKNNTLISKTDAEDAKCHTPSNQHGIPIINVDFETLSCPFVNQPNSVCQMEDDYEYYDDTTNSDIETTIVKEKLIMVTDSQYTETVTTDNTSHTDLPNGKSNADIELITKETMIDKEKLIMATDSHSIATVATSAKTSQTVSYTIHGREITSSSAFIQFAKKKKRPYLSSSFNLKGTTTVVVSSPFNLTSFNLSSINATSISVEWTVNKNPPSFVCQLALNVTNDNTFHTYKSFNCSNNAYIVTNMIENTKYNFCLISSHISNGNNSICLTYHPLDTYAKQSSDSTNVEQSSDSTNVEQSSDSTNVEQSSNSTNAEQSSDSQTISPFAFNFLIAFIVVVLAIVSLLVIRKILKKNRNYKVSQKKEDESHDRSTHLKVLTTKTFD